MLGQARPVLGPGVRGAAAGRAGRGPAGIGRRRPRRLCGDAPDTGPGRICRGSLYRDCPRRAGPGDHCPRDQHRRHARLADHPDRHRAALLAATVAVLLDRAWAAREDDHGGRL